ncbi:hypothetical protein [Methanoculleus sp.]|uniref:hypothetical protein n=1 Tax=Methanoculleus sp. TaxID=90427 RepID=UPI0025E31741|nr:hypothetical protein [Methanoculleus sp.]
MELKGKNALLAMFGNLFLNFQLIPLMGLRRVEDIAGAKPVTARKVDCGDVRMIDPYILRTKT